MKITELEEGKVYKTSSVSYLYRIKNRKLQILTNNERWVESSLQYNNAMKYDFIEASDPRIPNTSTPIDTKVLCWSEGKEKIRRHFAGIRNGEMTCFEAGKTSWTNQSDNILVWDNMIIAEEE